MQVNNELTTDRALLVDIARCLIDQPFSRTHESADNATGRRSNLNHTYPMIVVDMQALVDAMCLLLE